MANKKNTHARTFDEFAISATGHPWLEGMVTISMKPIPLDVAANDVYMRADYLASSLGYDKLGNKWKILDLEGFKKQLIQSLTCSLAYSVKMLPVEEAERVINEFLGFIGREAEYLVNGNRHGWHPITKSTMETAFVVLDCQNGAMFLFEDED